VRDASARAKAEARFAATRDAAISELSGIETQVGRLTFEIRGAEGDARVTVDGPTPPIARWKPPPPRR
jgi:hypothetical protein